MRTSLRLRLFLAVALITLAMLAGVVLVAVGATRSEIERIQDLEFTQAAEEAESMTILLEGLPPLPDPDGVVARVREWAQGRREWLLLDGADRIRAASGSALRAGRVTRTTDGALELRSSTQAEGAVEERALVFVGDAHAEFETAEGLLRLFVLPAERRLPAAATRDTLHAVQTWVLVAVCVGGGAGLVSILLLTRRLLQPLGALTEAAGRLERGDLSVRVPEAGDDEVAALAHAFNAMAGSLAETEEMRSKLVSDVAHELRTPLTNLRCQVDAVRGGLRPPEESFAVLDAELDQLTRLVDDLQELTLAEAGQLELRLEFVRLGPLVEQAVAAARNGDPARQATVESVLATAPEVRLDPARLRQVLANLLGNALRHTPPDGRVRVELGVHGDEAEIRVRDTGPGIAPADLPRVFDRFYRADPARNRAGGGAGLGLAIVKQLVEAQGGRVRVESQPGAGTTFFVRFPAARAGEGGAG